MTPELSALLAELEIKAVSVHAYRGPLTTMATACMESILREHGYGHLKLTLMSIAETERNKRELVAPTISAVSDLVNAHPHWAARASEWFAAFDKVDLGKLQEFARLNQDAVTVRSAMATLLFGFLSAELGPQPVAPVKRELAQPRPPRNKRALNVARAA